MRGVRRVVIIEDPQQLAQEVVEKYDGNHSTLYDYIKVEVNRLEAEGILEEQDTAFLGEFTCFEDDYALSYLSSGDIAIYDIGCQLGFGSLFYSNYTGVDIWLDEDKWFNSDRPGVTYRHKNALTMVDELVGKNIISNMVVGFFGSKDTDDEWLSIINDSNVFYGRIHRRIYERLDQTRVKVLKEGSTDPNLEFISPLIEYKVKNK